MPASKDYVLAIAVRKVRRSAAPKMPPAGEASIEQQGRIARAQKAFDAGEPVYDLIAELELMDERVKGTANLRFEVVMEDELAVMAARAAATIARQAGERAADELRSTVLPEPPGALQG